jgi:hypothetical protein
MRKQMFEILWPDHRLVSVDTINGWFADAVANGDIPGPLVNYPDSPKFKALALHGVGLITLREKV